jgi:hypothetical protein
MIDYITFTDIKMFVDIWWKAAILDRNEENSIYSNEFFTFKIAEHNNANAIVIVLRTDNGVVSFLIDNLLLEGSFIPESIIADNICRYLRKL